MQPVTPGLAYRSGRLKPPFAQGAVFSKLKTVLPAAVASLRSVLEPHDGQHPDMQALRRIRVFAILAKGVPPGTIGGYAHSCARGAAAPLLAERSEAMVSQPDLKLASNPPSLRGRWVVDRGATSYKHSMDRDLIFTVAIDGPAAAGKGTIGRAVADAFGFAHLDTGLLYRATGRKALAMGRGVIVAEQAAEIARNLEPADLERDDLRTARVGQAASKVAVMAPVRAALLAFQQAFARRKGGAVLDGRDIGTVICPDAEVKLFVTASDQVRAQRRFAELAARTPGLTLDKVMADLRQRDIRDSSRDLAPLKPADTAVILDTTDLSIDDAVRAAVETVRQALSAP